jgi:hypothetical protein
MSGIDQAFLEPQKKPLAILKLQNIIQQLAAYFTDKDPAELIALFGPLQQQLAYSFIDFSRQLQVFGFEPIEAAATAANIVLKPLAFALIPRALLLDKPSDIFVSLPGEPSEYVFARNHRSVQSVLMVYLHDEKTDDFNFMNAIQRIVADIIAKNVAVLPSSTEELEKLRDILIAMTLERCKGFHLEPEVLEKFVTKEVEITLGLQDRKYNNIDIIIAKARTQLLPNPNYYFNHLQNVVRSSGDLDRTFGWFDKVFMDGFKHIPPEALPELLAEFVADVITGEHYPMVIQESTSEEVPIYADFFIRHGLVAAPQTGSKAYALADSVLKNQGLTLVVYNILLHSGKIEAIQSMEEELQKSPELVQFMLRAMGLIRLLDDIGDRKLDEEHEAINILNADPEIKTIFMDNSRLSADDYLNAVVFGNENPKVTQLLASYKQMELEVDQIMTEDNRDLIQATKAVVFAAFINAGFNDIDAFKATMQLMRGD